MQRYPEYTRKRIAQLAQRIGKLIYSDRRPIADLMVSGPTDRISWAAAHELTDWRAAKLGDQFGPSWATFWFRGKVQVPPQWSGRRVDLQWISHSEATLWIDGQSVQGLNWAHGQRPDAVLLNNAQGGETLEFVIEMACNHPFGAYPQIAEPADGRYANSSPYVLDKAEIAAFDPEAWRLYYDFYVLQQLESELSKDGETISKSFAGELLFELNRFANVFDPADRGTWAEASGILTQLYQRQNADSTHELSAIGHAHIDTAWLWPLAETDRKCVRTFSSQMAYMEEYPQYKFACSQAYQYARIKQINPRLYQRISRFVKKGQFIPVGGTWIEPDCNIPSGESLCRQFLLGQRFFQREFGVRCREFWNPDVFGYNGQLPQIMNQAGISRFLTQKLSWNWFNKPQHHSFTWQGIDGSTVLTHFPPADTYNATAEVGELRKNARDYKDHDRSRHSLMLFGYGDGGGGPTKHMLEILHRAQDLQGLPRTNLRSSDEFFDVLEKDIKQRPVIIGELYFELHRGTYTTQAATKRANRKSEFLLHDIEFLSVIAAKQHGFSYPSADLEQLWQIVCLNQFHDILPGSSIGEVYQDSQRQYEHVHERGSALRAEAAQAIVGKKSARGFVPINTIGFARDQVAMLPNGELVFVSAPSYGIGKIVEPPDQVIVRTTDHSKITLENRYLRAELNGDGSLGSLIEKSSGRESLAGPGDFKIYDDLPSNWEAWDVEPQMQETEKNLAPATSMKITIKGGLRGEVEIQRPVGRNSAMTQTVRLDANARRLEFLCDVDWNETRKMLKIAFPVNVTALNATYEMQYGTVERPTHFNTSYDLARFEVPGHKWSDLSEHGFGVALLSESKYGFSTFVNTMRMSLLRATKHPDPEADIGKHHFAFALMPHKGWRESGVVAESFRFNVPLVFAPGATAPRCFASVDDPNLVLDTIKKAEDSDGVVVRLYETHGGRGTARLKIDLPYSAAVSCNILEEDAHGLPIGKDRAIELPYRPYQIISIKLM
jgi:alpha-mannosidase